MTSFVQSMNHEYADGAEAADCISLRDQLVKSGQKFTQLIVYRKLRLSTVGI